MDKTDVTDGYNVTVIYPTVSSPKEETVFDIIHIVIAGVSIVNNVIALVVLCKTGTDGCISKLLCLLLKHQSVVDALVCLCTFLSGVLPLFWTTGVQIIDLIVCHIWHSQFIYWFCVFISIQNLVCISIERYLAVCKPLLYLRCRKKHFYASLGFMYTYAGIVQSGDGLLVHMENRSCEGSSSIDPQTLEGLQYLYIVLWLVTCYIIPVTILCTLYALILTALRRTLSINHNTTHRTLSKATSELTKMAVSVTLFFIVFLGFDNIHYVLGEFGVTDYIGNMFARQIGRIMITLNCMVNPLVYFTCLPGYRQAFRLMCCFKQKSRSHLSRETVLLLVNGDVQNQRPVRSDV